MTTGTDEQTIRQTLARMDEGWKDFFARVQTLPGEELGARLGEAGWTRKQMLAHITMWHDLTTERMLRFAESGEPIGLPGDEDEDAINVRAARASEGRTSGEVIMAMTDSHRRLRRAVAVLTDAQLAAHDGWAATVIAGNSFGHYEEHLPDLTTSGAR
jgi:DinB family protein